MKNVREAAAARTKEVHVARVKRTRE